MRIATYNVEWFNGLFDKNDKLVRDDSPSWRHKVSRAEQADAIACVFTAMDADAILVVEAPDTSRRRSVVRALEDYAQAYGLRTREAVTGFGNDTKQEIALLFDPDKLSVQHVPRPGRGDVPRFDGVFEIDLDIDARRDEVRFSKPPLELDVVTQGGMFLKMIGVHLKSKAPHGAETPEDAVQIGIANRRKQLAQAIWLRKRVDQILEEGAPLIVLGDLNDGPGLDHFENLFGRSSLEIVLGNGVETQLYDPHGDRVLSQRFGAVPTTARFWIEQEQRYLQALLDYVLISPDLRKRDPIWRIWHPLDDPDCWRDPELREALVLASDHFPVSLDFRD